MAALVDDIHVLPRHLILLALPLVEPVSYTQLLVQPGVHAAAAGLGVVQGNVLQVDVCLLYTSVAQILLQRLAEDFPLDQLILRHQQLALHARSSSSP